MRFYGPNNANQWDPPAGAKANLDGISALADSIKDNRALVKLIFGGDSYQVQDVNKGHGRRRRNKFKTVTPEPAVLEVGTTEADLSNKNLGVGGAITVGA